MIRLTRPVAGLMAALALTGLTGCTATSSGTALHTAQADTPGQAQPATAAPAQPSSPATPGQSAGPGAGLPVHNGITGQIVTMPDGTQLSTTSADLPDVVYVHPAILGLGDPSGDPVAMAAGNHVEEIRQEEVTLPIGKAYLAVVVRGQNSAANSDEKVHELWLIAVRKHPSRTDVQLAYAIIGRITGDEAKAKAELLELGRHWQLPSE